MSSPFQLWDLFGPQGETVGGSGTRPWDQLGKHSQKRVVMGGVQLIISLTDGPKPRSPRASRAHAGTPILSARVGVPILSSKPLEEEELGRSSPRNELSFRWIYSTLTRERHKVLLPVHSSGGKKK